MHQHGLSLSKRRLLRSLGGKGSVLTIQTSDIESVLVSMGRFFQLQSAKTTPPKPQIYQAGVRARQRVTWWSLPSNPAAMAIEPLAPTGGPVSGLTNISLFKCSVAMKRVLARPKPTSQKMRSLSPTTRLQQPVHLEIRTGNFIYFRKLLSFVALDAY